MAQDRAEVETDWRQYTSFTRPKAKRRPGVKTIEKQDVNIYAGFAAASGTTECRILGKEVEAVLYMRLWRLELLLEPAPDA